jgi:hypothetical protein
VGLCPTANKLNDYCRTHTNSGVGNYWFYLLAHGDAGVNDNGDAYNVQGVGFEKASYIAHKAFVGMITSGSKYTDMRATTLGVANLRYGYCSDEHIQTQLAWDAVGVPGSSASNCNHIDLEHLNVEVGVFPNPTTGIVRIIFLDTKIKRLSLLDTKGAIVMELGDVKAKEQLVSLGKMVSGIYFLQVLDVNKGSVRTVKLVVL